MISATTRTAAGAAGAIRVERSPADTRDYRAVRLDNGLLALAVCDPSTDFAAAALDVNVGSANDPDARPGFAHFIEHTLFLGTEMYPDSDEYSRFIDEHGGSNNAATSLDHTVYFFDIDAAHLEGAIGRFAQFFVAPRFDRDCIERERDVIHSEYVSRLRDDRLRSIDAWRQALDPRHPVSRFPAGNASTLADRHGADIRDELIGFYEENYSSHLMKLVVIGREALDALEDLIRTYFSAVPRRAVGPRPIAVPIYREGLLPVRLDIKPIRDLRTISLSFAIPPLLPHYRKHPLAIVSHLLGHEGPGSLLSALKARGWAEDLSVGVGINHPDFATFGVTLRATEVGLAHDTAVVAMVFAYLDLIREGGIESRYYAEIAQTAQVGFRHLQKTPAGAYAVSLASALHLYPVREVLTAAWRFCDFDPALERRFLATLTPNRVLLGVTAKGAITDATTPVYKTPYRLNRIAPEIVANWLDPDPDRTFALPEPNPFVPGNPAMIAAPEPREQCPTCIVQRPGFELWHSADVEFEQPRTNLYWSVRSPIANDSPQHAVLRSLLVRMIEDALGECAYPAILAGQFYALSGQHRGITVRLSGWSDRQPLLFARVVSTLRAPPLLPRNFEAIKARYARQLRNSAERMPFRRARSGVRELMLESAWTEDALLAALDAVDLSDLRRYADDFFRRGEIVALAHGNITAENAIALGGEMERGLLDSMAPVRVTRGRVVRLDSGSRYVRWISIRDGNHALAVYIQGRGPSYREQAMIALIAQATGNRFFNDLRTERSIGYVVSASALNLLDIPGLTLTVQSQTHTPEILYLHMQSFVERSVAEFGKMPSAVFERHRAAVAATLLEAEERLGRRSSRYWGEIERENDAFDRRKRLLDAVRAIERNDLADAWRDLAADPEKARSLTVAASNRDIPVDEAAFGGAKPVEDPDSFKFERNFFDDRERAPRG